MKHNKSSHNANQKAVLGSRSIEAPALNQGGKAFPPSADEVAKRAYFSYVDQGSLPGHDVENWLKAEAGLRAEHKQPGPVPA